MSPTTLAPPVDNPVIDQQWYAGEISRLQAKLAAMHPTVPVDVIAAALEVATQRIALPAKIPNYLPVLIERDVRAQVAVYLQG
ncbi:MAG: three-helix bundle dimerization domain-containing protein [Sporichthyaceae bacterium]